MKGFFAILFLLSGIHYAYSQQDSVKAYNPKEELVYDGKRYRVHNNWISGGAGAGYNTHWPKDERNFGVDFSFHIKKEYFRIGGFMSGANFSLTNNYNAHVCYGIRKEKNKYNLSAFAGPSLSYFKRPLKDSVNYNLNSAYSEVGGFVCLEAIYKLKYDVGIGGQVFCDYNKVQMVYGVRLVAYFSGAYRGIKYGRVPGKK